jgi:subtilisin
VKFNPYFALFVAALFYGNPALWAAPASKEGVVNERSFQDANERTEFNRLTHTAVEDGSVQVLVVLKESKESLDSSGSPQGEEEQVSKQTQTEIEQDALLKDIPIRRVASVKRYKHLPFLALSASEKELQRLRTSPHVAQILRDKINYPATLDFSVRKIGADIAQASGYTGVGQTIAILDNGVDKRQSLLRNKVVAEACFSSRNSGKKVTPTCRNGLTRDLRRGSATVKCKFLDFECTHGTIIAEIAAGNSLAPNFVGSGVAPLASIIAIKADSLIENKKNCAPATRCRVFFDSDILRGLDFAYRQRRSFNIASINASLGGDASRLECRGSPIRRIVARLRAANIATIVASGNDGNANRLSSPACIPGVVSVGSTDAFDSVSSFSNNSPGLSLLAPGEDIGLAVPGVVPAGFEVVSSGTSLSAAFVSGVWATLKSQRPFASVEEILASLINTGVPSGDPKNSSLIKPRIQVDKALGLMP